jgi:hypothetical protein
MSRSMQQLVPWRQLVAVGLALGSSWSQVAAAAPGDHIRAGVVEIVPRVDLGLIYHSNIYRAETDPSAASNLDVSPGIAVSASEDDHEFVVDGAWSLQKYVFVGGTDGDLRSTRIANLDRFDTFNVGASAALFKRSVVGLKLSNDTIQRNWTIDSEEADVPYITQFRNAFGAGLRTNPAPALEITPGFQWTYDAFRAPLLDASQDDRSLNKRTMLGGKLDAKWAFLPRTALVGRFDYSNNSWAQNVVTSQVGGGGSGQLAIPNSSFVKGSFGIDGRFTERVSALALLGFGTSFFSADSVSGAVAPALDAMSATDGILVKAQLKYAIVPSSETTPGAAINLGYVKDFRSSFFTNYVAYNQLFAEFRGQFDRLEPSLRYEVRFEGYEGAVQRNDLVHVLRGGMGVQAAKFARFDGSLGYLVRTSSIDTIEYNDVHLVLGATFVY